MQNFFFFKRSSQYAVYFLQAVDLTECKAKIFEYVESRMSFIAPNLSIIVGASIAAKLMGESHIVQCLHILFLRESRIIMSSLGLILEVKVCLGGKMFLLHDDPQSDVLGCKKYFLCINYSEICIKENTAGSKQYIAVSEINV